MGRVCYNRPMAPRKPCTVPECTKLVRCKGLCETHYRKLGPPTLVAARKERERNRSRGMRQRGLHLKPKARYRTTAKYARQRGIEFKLTYEEYWDIRNQLCAYCNREIKSIAGGLDRIDSDGCYELGNVRPCCEHCNRGKCAMTHEQYLDHIRAQAEHLFKLVIAP